MPNYMQYPVYALNNVKSNVWSVVLIGAGIMLILWGHPNEGSALMTGAFAVFRTEAQSSPSVPQISNHKVEATNEPSQRNQGSV